MDKKKEIEKVAQFFIDKMETDRCKNCNDFPCKCNEDLPGIGNTNFNLEFPTEFAETANILEPNIIKMSLNNNKEIVRICVNGDIFVKGKLIENDKELVEAFRSFFKDSGYLK